MAVSLTSHFPHSGLPAADEDTDPLNLRRISCHPRSASGGGGPAPPCGSACLCEKEYPEETPVMIRLSMRNLSFDGKMLNVPLFMIDQLDRLLSLALKKA